MANLPVVHQRVTSMTANMYKKGDYVGSQARNNQWSNYLEDNFQESKYEKHQVAFSSKNRRLNEAIGNKYEKPKRKRKASKEMEMEEKKEKKISVIKEEAEELNKSIDSDEDQMELMENLMEKQSYNLSEDEVD